MLIIEIPVSEHYALVKAVYEQLVEQTESSCSSILDQQIGRCHELAQVLLKRSGGESPLSSKGAMLKQLMQAALAQERTFLSDQGSSKRAVAGALWDTFELLLKEAGQKVAPQGLILDLLLNVVVISGEQFAQDLFSQQDKEEEALLTARIKKVQEAFQATSTKMRQQTDVALKSLGHNFVAQIGAIQKELEYAQERFLQEVTYVQRLINLSVPPQRFIVNGIQAGRFFKASTMLTPSTSYPWHNVYQIDGDWTFDKNTGSFIQRGALGSQSGFILNALANPQLWRSQTGPSSAYAEQNHIFTEYFTQKSVYQIQVEMTLINCAYPFFAGIVFNKARWLSGSLERMNTYRLVGLYGANASQVGLYLGQTTIPASTAGIPFSVTPLNQIISGTMPALHSLLPAEVEGLSRDPLVFRFTLGVQESFVTLTLEKKTDTGWKQLFVSSITNLQPAESKLLFWYHGIGFMAPGCQAAFKIIQPEELSFIAGKA